MPHFGEPHPICWLGFFRITHSFGGAMYHSLNSPSNRALEAEVQAPIGRGRFTELKLYVGVNNVDGATTLVLRVNSVDTALTVTVPANTTGIFTVQTNVPVAEDDLGSFYIEVGGTVGSIVCCPSLKFLPG